MKEKMVLTSYLDKSYFVARKGKYVASIQMMSRDTLGQVTGQLLARKITTSMSQRLLCYSLITLKQVNDQIDVFLV